MKNQCVMVDKYFFKKKLICKFMVLNLHLNILNMKISIEGLIACGKTTVLSKLQNTIRLPVFLEPIDKWTLLNKFYEDTERWGFTFNIEVIMSMSKWKNNNYDSLYERSPNSCRWVFTQMQYEKGGICKEEIDLFDKLCETFSWDQDYMIYIKADPEVCYERMKKRNRGCEETVSLEYLIDLDKKHTDMINLILLKKPQIKVYIVDGNQDEDTVYNHTLDILKNIIDI